MDLTASVEPGADASSAVLVGNAAVIVNGKFAQFGGRLMGQVSELLLAQFADNFRAAAAALPAPDAVVAVHPATASSAPVSDVATAAAAAASEAAAPGPAAPAQPPRAGEINALGLLWGLIKGWFAGLFGSGGSGGAGNSGGTRS
jgi:hypothetical protein